MEYKITQHRHALDIINQNRDYLNLWNELTSVLDNISDQDLIDEFQSETRQQKSISNTINQLIKQRLTALGWLSESYIFADSNYRGDGPWRLDFVKNNIFAIEVGFNHGGNVSWNLIKPVLSSELNHVSKAMQTEIGIVIAATDEMKTAGGFDKAVGSYEKYCEYLKPLRNLLTSPLVIIGLKAPNSFKIVQSTGEGGRKIGHICML